jgi:ribosome-associated protein
MVAKAAIAKQADQVIVLDVRKLSSVTDWFIIATIHSTPQISAVREEIEAALRQQGKRLWHVEGESNARQVAREGSPLFWVLLDCGDVLVHLFNPPARQFYQLERLWGDAPQIPLEPGP